MRIFIVLICALIGGTISGLLIGYEHPTPLWTNSILRRIKAARAGIIQAIGNKVFIFSRVVILPLAMFGPLLISGALLNRLDKTEALLYIFVQAILIKLSSHL